MGYFLCMRSQSGPFLNRLSMYAPGGVYVWDLSRHTSSSQACNQPLFDLSLTPISIHSPTTPCTPIIDTLHITNPTYLTHTLVNDYLNGTQPHMNDTPTIMYDHSDFLNVTQTQKYICHMNGKYIYTTHA